MNGTKSGSGTPIIAFLVPSNVKRGWEGIVKIHGNDFDSGSFALFDGAVPKTDFKSVGLLEADVKNDITKSTGTKKVKVHTGGGDVSNEVDFLVEP
jgi:hypothetical protein